MTKLTKDDKAALFQAIMRLEHGTTESLSKNEYLAVLKLAEQLDTPEFIVNYFINKHFTATN